MQQASGQERLVRIVGRYAIHGELASGGMAAVHLGRLMGEVGFARTVAIKKLHPQYARDPEFVAMFLDEARLVSRIKHPNVVPTLDIVSLDGELFLVMEYIPGEPLSRIMAALGRQKQRMPINVAVAICLGLLEGLHAAHEAKAEDGTPMGIVHRDVSPQNLIVGTDGVPRVLDFGIAKAAKRIQTTEDGSLKGKLGYMPPEVLTGGRADRRADIWGSTVVLWEMLVGKRLFVGDESPFSLVKTIVENGIELPSRRGVASSKALDAVIERGLMKSPDDRFSTAREMALALEAAMAPASSRAIGDWLYGIAKETLDMRAAKVEEVERSSAQDMPSVDAVQGLATATSRSGPPAPLSAPPISGPLSSPISSHETVVLPQGFLIPAPSRRARRNNTIAIVLTLLATAVSIPAGVVLLPKLTQRPHGLATSTISPVASSAPITFVAESSSATTTVAPGTASASSMVSAHPTTPSTVRPATTAHTPPKSCVPPYTIGPPPDYIRKPKLECLPR